MLSKRPSAPLEDHFRVSGKFIPRRLWQRLLLAVLCICVAAELFARLYLGLGDPALVQTHPTIEYYFKPDQRVHPFGNLFKTNRYGMRSDDFPPQKTRAGELRVFVVGDSVVNGGNLTDHSRLATTLLQERLTSALRRPVVTGNVSAGSWGPPNQLAYIKQFGFLDADVVILVLSSSDATDAPTFEPLNPATHPTQAPWSAAWEGMTRYLPRYLRFGTAAELPPPPVERNTVNLQDLQACLAAERDFFGLARSAGVTAILLQHWEASELRAGQAEFGHDEIRQVAAEAGVPTWQDAEILRKYIGQGLNPYRDNIHLNDNGQRAYADFLFEMLQHDAADRLRAH